MQITDTEAYKVIEAEHCLLIIGVTTKISVTKYVELIVANMVTCAEFIARYGYERSQGRGIRDAHREALKGAQIILQREIVVPEGMETKQ